MTIDKWLTVIYDGLTFLLVVYSVRSFKMNVVQHFNQHRAWVCFNDIVDSGAMVGGKRTLHVSIRNSGVSPAMGDAKVALIDSSTIPTRNEIDIALSTVTGESGVLAPNQCLLLGSSGNLTYDKTSLVGDLYVVGIVRYGTMGKSAETVFCLNWVHPSYLAKGGIAVNNMV